MSMLSTDVQTDGQRVAKMVAGMAEILGVNAPPARIVGYVEALRDVPLDLLSAGIKRAIASWRYPDMPKPADIRAAVDAEVRDLRVLEAPPTDYPPQQYACEMCEDTGWRVTKEGVPPTVARCACYRSNPVLARQRGPAKYEQEPA